MTDKDKIREAFEKYLVEYAEGITAAQTTLTIHRLRQATKLRWRMLCLSGLIQTIRRKINSCHLYLSHACFHIMGLPIMAITQADHLKQDKE